MSFSDQYARTRTRNNRFNFEPIHRAFSNQYARVRNAFKGIPAGYTPSLPAVTHTCPPLQYRGVKEGAHHFGAIRARVLVTE